MQRTVAVILLFWVGFVQADPLTWYLRDVTFADNGTAFGSFVYDADTNTYFDVSIVTTNGNAFAGTRYKLTTQVDWSIPSAQSVNLSERAVPAIDGGELRLTFVSALTNAGGTVAISTDDSFSNEGLCLELPEPPVENSSCEAGGFVDWLRTVTAGTVSTTPKDKKWSEPKRFE